MPRERVLIGSFGPDDEVRGVARRSLETGLEVVYVGGDQGVEQLVRSAVAEDAGRVIVDADADQLERLRAACAELGIVVEALDTHSRPV